MTDTLAHASTQGPTSSAAMAARFDPLRDVLVPTAGEPENPRYVFGEVFARGGLGQIRHAFDRVLGRTIAIKETLSPGGVERFIREAQVTACLDHPAIIPVHDLGVHADGRPYYCMKLIDGRSLESVIAGTHTLVDRLLLLPNIVTVGEAVAFAHGRGVLHRDLKPANILIGNFGETWIIDWGLTGYLDSADLDPPAAAVDPARANLTHTGEWLGTLPYMAPEQRAGRRIDQRADVYGLGAVLYHTLSGRRPYADTPGERLDEHILLHPPTDLERLAPEIPADLLTIVAKAMARDPVARYPDVRTLLDDLRGFLAGRLVAAHTYRFRETVRRWARRHRSVLMVASVALVVLAAVGLYSVLRVADERNVAVRNEALARDHQQAAEAARDEALSRGAQAREALATMWEAEGRHRLLDDRHPLDAHGPLAQAAELAPDRGHLRTMSAHADRPYAALRCDIDVYTPDMLAVHPHLPLAAFSSDSRGRVELWDLDLCTMVDEWLLGKPVVSVGFSADGTELRGLAQIRTLALTHLELARLPLQPGAVPSYMTLPVTHDRGRFGTSADLLVLSRADGRTSSSVLMHVSETEPPRTSEVPAGRPRVSPDGTRISWLARGRIHTRDDTNTTITRPVGDARQLLAVDDDGDALLTGGEHLEILRQDGSSRSLERCDGRPTAPSDGVFHRPARAVVVQDSVDDLRLWDPQTGRCIGSVRDHHIVKWRLVAVAGEFILLTLDGDMRLSIWRLGAASLTHLSTLNCHESGIWDFDVQSTSSSLVTLGRDASMRVWDLTHLLDAPPVLRAPRIALHPAGVTAAVSDADGVHLTDLAALDRVVTRWSLPALDTLRWDLDGTLAARSGTRLYAWDPTRADTVEPLEAGHLFAVDDLDHDAIAGTSLVVVSGALVDADEDDSPTYDLRIHDRGTGNWHDYPDTQGRYRRPAQSPVSADAARLLLSDTGVLLDIQSMSRIAFLHRSAVFTPDGSGVLDVTRGEGLVLRSAATGVPLRVLDPDLRMPSRGRSGMPDLSSPAQRLSRYYSAAVFSPDGDAFTAGTGPDGLALWPGLDAARSVPLEGHRLPVYAVLWSRDGTRVLTRGRDNLACLWDANSGRKLAELANVDHDARVALGPDLVAVQDASDRVTLADLTTGHRLFAFPVHGLADLAFAPDGRHLYIVEAEPGQSMTLRVFDVHIDADP